MNKYFILIIFYAALLASCSQTKTENSEATAAAVEEAYENPALTEQQIAEGWRYIFDGKSLEGWRSYQNAEQNCWEVRNGMLHCKAAMDADKRADILTPEQFTDYWLSFEWKISEGGNSGVMYHASEEFDAPYYSGPEYQLIDDTGYKGDLTELQKSGAAYDMYAPSQKIVKPVGEWNETIIKVNGPHVEHWLNGVKVVEYETGSEDWLQKKAASKWKDEAGYGMTKKGFIDFQDHGHEVWFRNIKVRSDEYDG